MSQKLKLTHRDFFKTPYKTFAFVGIDPLVEGDGGIIKHPIICYGFYILTFIFALASIDFCVKNMHDINEIAVVISLLNQLAIVLWKIAIFLGKRRRIHKLIKDIWQWNEKANSDDLQIISIKSKTNALVSKFYYMIVLFTGVVGLLLPLIIKLVKLLQGLEGDLEVPHKASYFWNTSSYGGYAVAFLWNVIAIHFLLNASVAIDTLFLWFVSNIVIRFCILKVRLKEAGEQYQSTLFRNIIKKSVKFHLKILYLAQELDSIFGEIIFVKSLISCTQICFLAFCLMSTNTSVISLLHPFIFLLAVSMQLILYCYYGHLIEEQSLMVSADIFETFNWSRIPVPYQKMLQMIMLRSQKSAHITGIFFNLNLNLYLWFFKTAGSLIAVLKTLEDDI